MFLQSLAAGVQEKDLVRLKREAKAQGGFYVPPEHKLLFVIRIRGLNKVHPKVKIQRGANEQSGQLRGSKSKISCLAVLLPLPLADQEDSAAAPSAPGQQRRVCAGECGVKGQPYLLQCRCSAGFPGILSARISCWLAAFG
jgi:hypothetical protein